MPFAFFAVAKRQKSPRALLSNLHGDGIELVYYEKGRCYFASISRIESEYGAAG